MTKTGAAAMLPIIDKGEAKEIYYLSRKIERLVKEVDKYKGYNSHDHSFHGGWSKGYVEGRLSAFQDVLERLEDGLM